MGLTDSRSSLINKTTRASNILSPCLFTVLKLQVDMFLQRYAIVHQRILRQDLFRPKLVTAEGRRADDGSATHVLTPVESLLGRSGTKFLLGMIVQVSSCGR